MVESTLASAEARPNAMEKLMEKTARRILNHAGDDAELNALVEELMADAGEHGQVMAAMDMKKRYFSSYSVMMSRAPDGKARR